MRGAIQTDELGKWSLALFVLVVLVLFFGTQYDKGVFSFFRQIPSNFSYYDSEDGSAFVRLNVDEKHFLEYRTTASCATFSSPTDPFTLGRETFTPSVVHTALFNFWFIRFSEAEPFRLSLGTLEVRRSPERTSNENAVFTWWGLSTSYECPTNPCIYGGDLVGLYKFGDGTSPGFFILRANNDIAFAKNTANERTFVPDRELLAQAKGVLLAYRDGILPIPVSIDGKHYCINYMSSGNKGHLVVNLAIPVQVDTTCI